jgi:RimJ/RimL family protein N-acetyltransferase
MPTYAEHVKFVKSKPYSKWYVIYFKNKKSGSIYLSKHNEIGIFLKKGMHGKGIGSLAMMLLIIKNPRDRFLANISPKNKKSIEFFKKNGFTLIQHTYELTKWKENEKNYQII